MDLANKVAVITGAGSGIGRATALRLARAGTRVVIADCSEENGHGTVNDIKNAAGTATFIPTDVSRESNIIAMFDHAIKHYGGIDILYNNAGILGGPRFPDTDEKYWGRAIDINIKGVLYGIAHGVPALKQRGGGVIINTASTAGLTPSQLDPVYGATKAAVVNLTRSLTFLQQEAGIRINCVCPALVRTALEQNSSDMLDPDSLENFLSRRAGRSEAPALTPDEVASAVLRLIEDDTLNGVSYKLAVDQEWELIPSLQPQKVC